MKFVSSRELRISPGTVWKKLANEKDLVITSNGRPIGILTLANEDILEDVLEVASRWKGATCRAHPPPGRGGARSEQVVRQGLSRRHSKRTPS